MTMYDNPSIDFRNLNYLRNKRAYLRSSCVPSPTDVSCIDVTKLDDSFLDFPVFNTRLLLD